VTDEYQTYHFWNMKKSELKHIIKEEISETLSEETTTLLLVKELSSLYNSVVMKSGVDDEVMDEEMENIIKKVGLTPKQKAKRGFYKFAFGEHPEFSTLTDKQLLAIKSFLEVVNKRRRFREKEMWDGIKIVKNLEHDKD
jgi:hypothetical protein